jgi:hypothetical protein
MTDAYWRSVAEKDFGSNTHGTREAWQAMDATARMKWINRRTSELKEQAKQHNVTTNEELQKKIAEWWEKHHADKLRADLAKQRAQEAKWEAQRLKRQYGHVQTGDLLELDKTSDKDLMKFPSREEELKGLFGGRGKKSRKTKKSTRKARKTRRRRA